MKPINRRPMVLNLGLRYEIDTPITEVNGLLSNLLPGRGAFVVGSDELPRLHNIDKNSFAPRVGFAYRATDDGKWTVRGGAGIYHDNCGRPYKYEIKMEGRQVGKVVLFKGTTDLGAKDGGVYDWIGRANEKEFVGFFTSAYYTGTFNLARAKAGEGK